MNRRGFLQTLIGSAAGLMARPWGWLTGPVEMEPLIEPGLFESVKGNLFSRTVFPQGVTMKNRETWTYTFAIHCDQKGNMTVEDGVFDLATGSADDMSYIGIG